MKRSNSDVLGILLAAALSMALVIAISLLTNSVDIKAFTADFLYYIDMAKYGFAKAGASPFAYRYPTTLIVHALVGALGISIEAGFRTVAYVGAFLQLFGIFLFTKWFTRSVKGAFVALLVTAFSLYNVKYLFFDVYRPDHLAYALILLQTYLAFRRKFVPLLLVTIVASQVREFNLIPLVAYIVAFLPQEKRSTAMVKGSISVGAILLAIALPRLLIPVTQSFQFVDLSRDGLLRALLAPLILTRDLNFLYTTIAYLLPTLMLARLQDVRAVLRSLPRELRYFLAVYVGLVLAFSFLGGTDFFRFATFLFLPQAIVLGFLVPRTRLLPLAVMMLAVFLFNRIWMPFPTPDTGLAYMDLYGGYSTAFNIWSVLRVLECAGLLLIGFLVRRLHRPAGYGQPLAANDYRE